MIFAPASEIPQIGRGPVYIGTLALFVVLQVPTALATNFGMLLAFRFITGFVGSPSLATGGASIADMYSPAKYDLLLLQRHLTISNTVPGAPTALLSGVLALFLVQPWVPFLVVSLPKPTVGNGPSGFL